jgi:putative DNA primase/helicase
MNDWPAPQPLHLDLLPVAPFREDLLPASLRAFAVDIAERMQVPLDFPAVAIMLCLAGAVNRRATIQPKAQDTSWVAVPNLWGGIVAAPGFMKSPLLSAVKVPLARIEDEWQKANQCDYRQYLAELEEWEAEEKRHKRNQNGNPLDGLPQRPDKPTPKRLIINDSTFEKLHEILRDNPAGLFVVRDELTGWLAELDRAGREGERAFYLTAWNGDTSHTIDRIGRGSIYVPACCLSMLGGIQPELLRSYLANKNLGDDGLIQRFQLLVWPDLSPDYRYVDRCPNPTAQERVEQIFRRLVALNAETPLRFRFDGDAQEYFATWFEDLETELRGTSNSPLLTSHLGKYRSLMPSLALLFELADRAARGFEGFEGFDPRHPFAPNVVSPDNMLRSLDWYFYLRPHAQRIYSSAASPEQQAAFRLAARIKDGAVDPMKTGTFSARDVEQKGWKGLDTPEKVRQAISYLQSEGWIREIPKEPGPKGGRPTVVYEINPRIWAEGRLSE